MAAGHNKKSLTTMEVRKTESSKLTEHNAMHRVILTFSL